MRKSHKKVNFSGILPPIDIDKYEENHPFSLVNTKFRKKRPFLAKNRYIMEDCMEVFDMKFPLFASLALVSAFASSAFAQTITPTRVGPVSQYGQLMTGKNSQNQGRIYGSCEGVKDGAEVQVRGMSLYWSLMPEAMEFWTEEGITTMVNDMNIQIVRAAMATKASDDWKGEWNGIQLKGWEGDKTNQTKFVKTVVEAAIKNDIYVIIDWHSHSAHEQTNSAKEFFTQMAQEYGQYDNVIFEVYNEPQQIQWSAVKNYANEVIAAIRQYSDNLVLVGNPSWDQNPSDAIGNEVTDSKKNTAYTLHYYANSHCWQGSYGWGDGNNDACEGTKGEKAMNAGLSVFISEWGTGNSDGGGTPDQSRNQSWQEYANKHKLSWANWSASMIKEGTAAFQSGSSKTSLQYTTSGNLVKGYLSTNPKSYTACKANVPESSSSSVVAIPFYKANDNFSISFANGKLALESTGSGVTKIEVFDLLGNTRLVKEEQLPSGSHLIDMGSISAGKYIARVRQGANSRQVRFDVR